MGVREVVHGVLENPLQLESHMCKQSGQLGEG